MSEQGDRRDPLSAIDRAAFARLDRARLRYQRKVGEGTATDEDLREVRDEVRRFGEAAGWDTPEVQEQVAQGRYRAPGFVVDDDRGYDRELAKRSVGPGWAGLIDEIFDRRDREYPGARLVQVKEKWGALYIYIEAPHEQMAFDDVIEAAEDRSCTICERCGEPGVPREGGWIKTLCDAHAEGRPRLEGSRPAATEAGQQSGGPGDVLVSRRELGRRLGLSILAATGVHALREPIRFGVGRYGWTFQGSALLRAVARAIWRWW